MRCQDIERLIMENSERDLVQEERLAIEQHLAQCPACASYRDLWEGMHGSLQKVALPELPAELEQRVRLACYEEINSRLQRQTRPRRSTSSASVPWPIWAALAVLTVLTAAFLVPGIEKFLEEQSFSLETVLVLGLILQNALMLFFAPVVMRRHRFSQSAVGEIERFSI
jgi:anti-sigma factor RsiW